MLGPVILLLHLQAGAASPVPPDTAGPIPSEAQVRLASWQLEQRKFWLSLLGFAGTIGAIGLGVRQYRRAEQWKRAEFLAGEMKEFFANPRVLNTLTMIDWGVRQVNLDLLEHPSEAQLKLVTRELQCQALLPHVLQDSEAGSDREGVADTGARFGFRSYTADQAAIRDCYDVFLDGLERFGSYVSTGLVSAKEFRPYLGYWIDDIAAPTTDEDDAAWTCCFLAYVHFYRYLGVRALFAAFGYRIEPTSPLFAQCARTMKDPTLVRRLSSALQMASPV